MQIISQKSISYFFFIMILFTICSPSISLSANLEQLYEGPPLSREETAVLFLDDIQILSINNIVKNYWDSACEFLPGKYNLQVRYFHFSPKATSSPMEIIFTAESGHNYVLVGIFDTRGSFISKGVYFTPFIEDISSKEYNPDLSKLTEKEYHTFNKKIAKSKAKHLKSYKNFLRKLGAFEPIRISFYEYDGSTIPKNIKANTSFNLALTRYIIAELKVKNLNPELKEQRHTLRWKYYYPRQMSKDGKWIKSFEVCNFISEMVITSGQEYAYPWVSWGSKGNEWIWEKGKGKKGTYAVVVYLDDLEIFEDRFVIY